MSGTLSTVWDWAHYPAPLRRRNAVITSYSIHYTKLYELACKTLCDTINNIKKEDFKANIIVMGDFNDNPNDESVMLMKDNAELFNPMETLLTHERGSQNHDS